MILTPLLLLCIHLTGCTSKPYIIKKSSAGHFESAKEDTQRPEIKHFDVGEYYKYQVDWLGVPVGYVVFQVVKTAMVKGDETYQVRLRAMTNEYASKIYKIDDRYTSYVEKKDLVPVRYDADRKEGGYRKNSVTFFDHEKKRAYFKNYHDGSEKEYDIPHGVQDPISSIMKARSLKMRLGDSVKVKVANNEKVYDLNVRVERCDIIEIDGMDEYEAFYLTPYADLEGKRVKKGKVSGYISTDKKRRLIYAEVRAPLFTKLTVKLVEMGRSDEEVYPIENEKGG